MKNYFGEKYAFEYAFLIHYQSWLILPAFSGLLVAGSTITSFVQTGELSKSIDTTTNGIFGLIVAIWATLFLESWKQKQRTIQYLWNCSDISYSKADERDEFKYYEIYNEVTDKVEKFRKRPNKFGAALRDVVSYFFCFLVIVAMVIYQLMIDKTKGVWENGELVTPQTFEQRVTGYVYTSVYSLVVIIFGSIYKWIALL
jgi:hypothetical protein